MKGTAFSGNLPFAEFADGQIRQADKSLGRTDQKNCSPAVCLLGQRAAVSAFLH
jgi:hypothetical protein